MIPASAPRYTFKDEQKKCVPLKKKYATKLGISNVDNLTPANLEKILLHKIERDIQKTKFTGMVHTIEAFFGLVFITLALYVRYFDYMKGYKSTFIIELVVYFISGILIVVIPSFIRRGFHDLFTTFVNGIKVGFILVIIMILWEAGGGNIFLISETSLPSTTQGPTETAPPESPFLTKIKHIREEYFTNAVWAVALAILLIIVGVFFYVVYNAFVNIHAMTFNSIFAVDPNTWTDSSAPPRIDSISMKIKISLIFFLEMVLVGVIGAVPLVLTIYNRNKAVDPEMSDKDIFGRKFSMEKGVGVFVSLVIKIGIFYIIVQLCGGLDWYNDGFCRTEGGWNRLRTTTDAKDEVSQFIKQYNTIFSQAPITEQTLKKLYYTVQGKDYQKWKKDYDHTDWFTH